MARFLTTAMMGLVCFSAARGGVVIDTVTVGNPGNADDTHGGGYGGVDYVYDIGTFEVTAGQYTEFLNAVAATDNYGLYSPSMWGTTYQTNIQRSGSPGEFSYSVAPDWADRPVNYVSWGDAARLANWMHNGQPSGDQGLSTTEDGSYLLDGATSRDDLLAVIRKPDATWVIPSEDEWYKAAYHKNDGATGNHWDYPTASDRPPGNDLLDPDPGNNANLYSGGFVIGSPYFRTEVGEFENSASPYGTFDQGGNVWEWNEAVIDLGRNARGASFRPNGSSHADYRDLYNYPGFENYYTGFRLAQVPEPATLSLLTIGAVLLTRRRVPSA